MISPQEISFEVLLRKYYADGLRSHGDLQLSFSSFSNHIRSIVDKHYTLKSTPDNPVRFVESLHLNDLYLSIACSCRSESAWARFTALYKHAIFTWAYFACEGRGFVDELAQSVLTDLYLPDQSGNSRIASYDGRSALASWLQVIIKHRAINEQKRKDNNLESIDSIPARSDERFFDRLNAKVRASQYELIIKDSFNTAVRMLTRREQLILLLRYEKGLQSAEIARSFGLSPSALSRQIQGICRKLQKEILSCLITTHRLNATALKECISDIMENPAHSILEMIKLD